MTDILIGFIFHKQYSKIMASQWFGYNFQQNLLPNQNKEEKKQQSQIFDTVKASKGYILCQLCNKQKNPQKMYSVTDKENCGHLFCISCLELRIISCISRNQDITCPIDFCLYQLDPLGKLYADLPDHIKKQQKRWKQSEVYKVRNISNRMTFRESMAESQHAIDFNYQQLNFSQKNNPSLSNSNEFREKYALNQYEERLLREKKQYRIEQKIEQRMNRREEQRLDIIEQRMRIRYQRRHSGIFFPCRILIFILQIIIFLICLPWIIITFCIALITTILFCAAYFFSAILILASIAGIGYIIYQGKYDQIYSGVIGLVIGITSLFALIKTKQRTKQNILNAWKCFRSSIACSCNIIHKLN